MSQPVGRHRATRQATLRRPAAAATATLSALAVSAAGYASATDLDPSAASGSLTGIDGLTPPPKPQSYQSFDRSEVLAVQQSASRSRLAASSRDKVALAKRMADAKRLQATASQSQVSTLRQLVDSRTSQAQDMIAAKVATPKPQDKPAAKPQVAKVSAERDSSAKRAEQPEPREEAKPKIQYDGSPRSIARSMLASYGWGSRQFGCLDKLWMKESGWRVTATNPSSGAYGIPQSLPGRKMASAGSDWRSNAATQIRWGLGYINERYGSPCNAWGHSVAKNWY